MIRLYTTQRHSIDRLARHYHRDPRGIRVILENAGVTIRRSGRIPIDPAQHQPHTAYCALCEQQALYVFVEGGGTSGGVTQDGGTILEVTPHPAGRWVDRGDGIYQRRAKPPADGSGHRGHACGRHHPGTRGSYTTNPDNETPLERWPEAPRYCPSCGCRLARDNRNKICSTCDTKAEAAHDTRQAWLLARGLL